VCSTQFTKLDTAFGPCWHRYNHDGYGQREDGGPFEGWDGPGLALADRRARHYELAATARRAALHPGMERFATKTACARANLGRADRPDIFMYLGQPTGGGHAAVLGSRGIHQG